MTLVVVESLSKFNQQLELRCLVVNSEQPHFTLHLLLSRINKQQKNLTTKIKLNPIQTWETLL